MRCKRRVSHCQILLCGGSGCLVERRPNRHLPGWFLATCRAGRARSSADGRSARQVHPKMKLQIMSDLHLEMHADRGAEFIRSLDPTGVDVLVLAGDITMARHYEDLENVSSCWHQSTGTSSTCRGTTSTTNHRRSRSPATWRGWRRTFPRWRSRTTERWSSPASDSSEARCGFAPIQWGK